MTRVVTDQRRADIYEQLLISEDKRVIDVEDLKRLRHLIAFVHPDITIEPEFLRRINELVECQPERMND